MARFPKIAAAVIVAGAFAPSATAQAPPAPRNPATATPRVAPAEPRQPTEARPVAPSSRPAYRRSVVHRYAYPSSAAPERTESRSASAYEQDDTRSAGYRNPGGVGRYLEYYPPGNAFQAERDPVRVAQFGGGGVPDRDEQRAAQQVGIQRYNSIQGHIDSYARPYGYGFGFGAFGGFN